MAGITTRRGTTVADGRPTENWTVSGDVPGLARVKSTAPFVVAVVWAKYQVVSGAGDPSSRERPVDDPTVCCWSSVATSDPEADETRVATVGWSWTKVPTCSSTSWPGAMVSPW